MTPRGIRPAADQDGKALSVIEKTSILRPTKLSLILAPAFPSRQLLVSSAYQLWRDPVLPNHNLQPGFQGPIPQSAGISGLATHVVPSAIATEPTAEKLKLHVFKNGRAALTMILSLMARTSACYVPRSAFGRLFSSRQLGRIQRVALELVTESIIRCLGEFISHCKGCLRALCRF